MKIKMLSKIVVGLFLSLQLVSCATMTKNECIQADWYIKGLEDASQGYALSRVADHSKACARVKVKPSMKDYETGHLKGSRLYCTPEKGYTEGRSGGAYNGICPKDLENQFLRAYRDGQELFSIQRNLNNLNQEISNNQNLVQADYEEIQRLKSDIVDRNSLPNERQSKLNRIDELQHQIIDLEIRIDRAAQEAELFQRDFQSVEAKHFRMGYIHH
jgi:hypothetical protein